VAASKCREKLEIESGTGPTKLNFASHNSNHGTGRKTILPPLRGSSDPGTASRRQRAAHDAMPRLRAPRSPPEVPRHAAVAIVAGAKAAAIRPPLCSRFWGPRMAIYRFYILDADAALAGSALRYDCPSDSDAIKRAHGIAGHFVELWQDDRRIGRFDGKRLQDTFSFDRRR
jgi:hypothetical protein